MNLNPEDIPSMNNIYSSKYWDKVKQDEQILANDKFEKSRSPFETGIVSRSTNSSDMYSTIDHNKDTKFVYSLTGNKMDAESFTHNNMQHFLKKNVTQNTDIEHTGSKLDMSTGGNMYWKKKQEVESFFIPSKDLTNLCGMKNNDDFYKSRVNSSLTTKTNNFFPIEKVRVGPGLNKGYDSKSSGGFQQQDTLEYAKPRSMDELRTKINQKNTYFEIPFQAPIQGTHQRGVVAPYDKNRPDKTYRQTEDQWIKTTGSVIKESSRPGIYVKPTTRPESHREYKGISTNNNKKAGIKDDYGKQNIIVYDTERQTTEKQVVVSNLTSIVKAIVSPVVDALKLTMKEYTVESTRAVGNPSIQIPSKATLYDPDNHIMKTTVKETTIHDSEMNNLTGNKETYSALQDLAKTTVKETTIHDSEMNNLTGNKETYSALQDVAKTTIKETSIHDTTISNIKGGEGTYATTDDEAKKTLRQTLPKIDTIRNIGTTNYKVYVYDPDMVVKTTIKQTTIKGKSEFGFLGGVLEGLFGGYLNANIELKNTQKQFLSDTNEYGIAGSLNNHKQTDRTATDNAEIDGTREAILIAAGHTPNPGNVNIGIDSEDIEMSSRKHFQNDITYRENGNIGVTYQSTPEPLNICSITKTPQTNNAFENRLDSGLLEAINTNDFAIQINPIKRNCRI